MNGSSRRQWILLSVLVVAVLVYFRYGGASPMSTGGEVGDLPAIDAVGLVKALLGINTVKPELVQPPMAASDPDRNIFQYGEKRPPPPPPMTEEQRKAEEQRLKDLEAAARVQQEKQAEDAVRQAQVAAEQAAAAEAARLEALKNPPPPAPPPPPVKPTPPEINYKFVGVMGPAVKKVGVFMDGEKMVLARKGEIIDGKFRVIDIGMEWAWLGWADPRFKDDRKRLDLGH